MTPFSVSAWACSNDDDFYAVDLPPNSVLDVRVLFSHANGDVDVQVRNSAGQNVAAGTSVSDNEFINIGLPGGRYYVRVYGFAGASNSYTLEVSLNVVPSACGNGVLEPPFEVCDGTDTGGVTCADFGLPGNVLGCRFDCSDFDTTTCVGMSFCGNDFIEPGEVCDGFDTGGVTCQDFGLNGFLLCLPDCSDFDIGSCQMGFCGNSIVEPGEACVGMGQAGFPCKNFGVMIGL